MAKTKTDKFDSTDKVLRVFDTGTQDERENAAHDLAMAWRVLSAYRSWLHGRAGEGNLLALQSQINGAMRNRG